MDTEKQNRIVLQIGCSQKSRVSSSRRTILEQTADYLAILTHPNTPPHRLDLKVTAICAIRWNMSVKNKIVRNVRVSLHHRSSSNIQWGSNSSYRTDTLLPLHYLLFQSNVFYLDRKSQTVPLQPAHATTFSGGAFFVAENEDKDRETSDAVFWIKRHCHKPNHLPKPFSQLPSMRNSVFWIPIMPLGEHAEAVVRTEVSDHIWSSGVARTWESHELLPRDHRSNVLSWHVCHCAKVAAH